MAMRDLRVRPAVRGDVAETARMLARSFEDDPAFGYQLPHGPSRRGRLARYFATLMVRETLPLGATEVAVLDGTIAGAALWKPPGRWQPPLSTQLAALPGYLTCFQFRAPRAVRTESVMFREHPKASPHWYLHVIGTEPALQGRGVGAALLRSRLSRVDAEGLPAYLESSKLANVPLYEHFGFEVTGVLGLPAAAPPITAMWRPAA